MVFWCCMWLIHKVCGIVLRKTTNQKLRLRSGTWPLTLPVWWSAKTITAFNSQWKLCCFVVSAPDLQVKLALARMSWKLLDRRCYTFRHKYINDWWQAVFKFLVKLWFIRCLYQNIYITYVISILDLHRNKFCVCTATISDHCHICLVRLFQPEFHWNNAGWSWTHGTWPN